ncbi:hypothetical protein B0H11DRAFT_1990971 [Mycena galericulata]|nr:hypothetical protein B0H11DRAFT_1990971 [Mycena galericulata]
MTSVLSTHPGNGSSPPFNFESRIPSGVFVSRLSPRQNSTHTSHAGIMHSYISLQGTIIVSSPRRSHATIPTRSIPVHRYKSSHPRRPKVENGHPFEASRIGEVSRSPHDGLAVGVRVGRSQRVVLKARRTVPHICNIASVFLTSSPPIAIEAHGGNGCWERNVWDGAAHRLCTAAPKQRQPAEKQKQRVPCRSPGKASPSASTKKQTTGQVGLAVG